MKKVHENLYISDILYVKNNELEDFDYIMNVSGSNLSKNDFHFPLTDGNPERPNRPDTPDNKEKQKENFSAAVQTLINLLKDKKKVLIHCEAGISRSPTVAATALSIYEDKNYEELLYEIGQPSPEVKRLGQKYLLSEKE